VNKFLKIVGLVAVTAIAANADPMAVPVIDTVSYQNIATGVLGALVVFFGIRKGLSLIR